MDARVRRYLQTGASAPLEALAGRPFVVCESNERSDEPGNRVVVQRIAGADGLLVTVGPGSVEPVTRAMRALTPAEVFSPLGATELCRALGVGYEPGQYHQFGFDYVLTGLDDFRPSTADYPVRALRKDDIPESQVARRLAERRPEETDDFVWAFACYRDDPGFRTGDQLAAFGAQCAAVAVVFWDKSGVALFGVTTDGASRGRGHGLAVVSAAAGWVLEQGEAAVYGAYGDNVPSLRIARRLGFAFLQQQMGV